jgi:hypothetical protein
MRLLGALVWMGCVPGKVIAVGRDTSDTNGQDTSGQDTGAPSADDTDTSTGITYSQVRDEVFVPSCGFGGCHGTGAGGLTLTLDTPPSALINVLASGMPNRPYVVPGEPDNSYIVQKMEGTAGIAGSIMPTTGIVEPERVTMVRNWILAGAR